MAGAGSVRHLFQEDGANWKLETGNSKLDKQESLFGDCHLSL